jgi:hypothetical protein
MLWVPRWEVAGGCTRAPRGASERNRLRMESLGEGRGQGHTPQHWRGRIDPDLSSQSLHLVGGVQVCSMLRSALSSTASSGNGADACIATVVVT